MDSVKSTPVVEKFNQLNSAITPPFLTRNDIKELVFDAPESNQDTIELLKKQISNGKFAINNKKIARSLLCFG